jgi:hypothetical protein
MQVLLDEFEVMVDCYNGELEEQHDGSEDVECG